MPPEALQANETNDFGGVVDELDLETIDPSARGDIVEDDVPAPANDPVEDVADEKVEPEETTEEAVEPQADEPEPVKEPAETPEEPEEKTKSHKVPVSRLNKEVEKRREAESRYEELQKKLEALEEKVAAPQQEAPTQQEPSEPEYDVTSKMQEAMTLAMDGDLEKSAALMAEVISKSNDQAVKQATEASKQDYTQMTAAEKEQAMLTQTAEKIVNTYPQFNSDSESYDAAMTEELKDYRDAFFAKGEEAHAALEKAKDLVVRLHGLDQAEAPQETAPAKEPKKDVKKAVDAAIKTPPKTSGDLDTEKAEKRIEDFTEEEFEKLSPAELKKLRGDFE